MMLYFFCLRIITPIVKVIYHIEYKGIDHIPCDGKLIVCSNHKSVIDPVFLAIPFKRQIRYMAKSELFQEHGKLASWFLHKMGAFPVKRNSGDAESIRTAMQILEDNGVLGIFPQGKCVFDNTPFKPKAGVALVASKTKAPVLPVSIYCDGIIKPFRRVTVRFGEAIPYAELNINEDSLVSMRTATDIIAKKINNMLEEKH
jgi:1-acyl-sn-glycerol-3-phosphate acyltransferase